MANVDFGNLQKQFRDMQKKIAQIEADLKDRVVEGTSGGNMVRVKMNGVQETVQVEISPEVLASGDKTMLEELVLAAVNEAAKKSKALHEKEMAKATGVGGVPGLLGM
jgi:DNA-binding YbaB/EbfC family protein